MQQIRNLLTVCADLLGGPERRQVPAPGHGAAGPRVRTSAEEFTTWTERRGRRRLLLEDFYRDARRRLDILMDGAEPAGGRWNFGEQKREPPPEHGLDVRDPAGFSEDEIDEQVRGDLDRWQNVGEVQLTGEDGPRGFAVTRAEARRALRSFIKNRLPAFGPQQDAMLAAVPFNPLQRPVAAGERARVRAEPHRGRLLGHPPQ